ncbi:MAG TPA: MFS transporter [Chlamydiales bacterium]|nr:MFS transporter [Chlamydiales bacterium]
MIRKRSFYSLIFTMFNDGLGWGIVLTIFAPLVLDVNNGFLPADTSIEKRNVLLGFLIACYPFTQFLFMPFIGALSDHLGRKKVLEWTILSGALTFVLSALSVWWGSIVCLVISRILAGICSANAATAQAAIADMSSEREKGKNLALSGIAGGISWIVGPPLGGILSSHTYFAWADFSTPLWFAAALFFINYVWIVWGFSETRVKDHREKHDWKQEIRDLSKLSRIPQMSGWLVISGLFFLGWGFFILFYPALLVQHFHVDQTVIGLFSGYQAIFWLIGATAMNRGLALCFLPEVFILGVLPIVGVLVAALAYTPTTMWWYVILPCLAMGGSILWNSILALLSNLAGKENQGKVFGVSQSLMSFGMFVSSILAGSFAAISEKSPLLASSLCLIGTGILACVHHFRSRRNASFE